MERDHEIDSLAPDELALVIAHAEAMMQLGVYQRRRYVPDAQGRFDWNKINDGTALTEPI